MIKKFIYLSAVIFVISLDLTEGKLKRSKYNDQPLCNWSVEIFYYTTRNGRLQVLANNKYFMKMVIRQNEQWNCFK